MPPGISSASFPSLLDQFEATAHLHDAGPPGERKPRNSPDITLDRGCSTEGTPERFEHHVFEVGLDPRGGDTLQFCFLVRPLTPRHSRIALTVAADALGDSGTPASDMLGTEQRTQRSTSLICRLRCCSPIHRPANSRCPKCGAIMPPAGLIPGLSELSQRIFKCERCNRIEVLQETDSSPKCTRIAPRRRV
jgi:hypothetical protein